jgi:hypothetical protein
MRLALVSLIALAAGASALAQTPSSSTPAPTPPAAVQPPAPPTTAPAPAAPVAPTPPSNAATPSAPTPAAEAPTPPPPPPPPPPPTDPTAIAVLNVLDKICVPSAHGGNLPQLAKADGFRKNSDNNWVMKTRDYAFTVLDPGTNPTQCHVFVNHPIIPDSPGQPIVLALNGWANPDQGWSLYRNDKSVQEGFLYTTRSWQREVGANEESLVFATKRKPDGSPLHSDHDESEFIYGVAKVG